MITILHGGGSLGTPKSDYVICARPLTYNLYVTLDCSLVGKCHSELRLRNKEEICHSMHVKSEIWVEALIGTLLNESHHSNCI